MENRPNVSNLEKSKEKCRKCVGIQEERDSLVYKSQLQQLQIGILHQQYRETCAMLRDSQKEIALLKNDIHANAVNEVQHQNEDVINGNDNVLGGSNPDVSSFLEFPMEVNKNANLKSGEEEEELQNDSGESSRQKQVCYWMHPNGKKGRTRCGQSFTSIAKLVSHFNEDHMNACKLDGYLCSWRYCKRKGVRFKSKSRFVIHLRDHTGEKPFRCPHEGCGKAFKARSLCAHHERVHRDVMVRCPNPACFKVFNCKKKMATHHRLQHEEVDREEQRHEERCDLAPAPDRELSPGFQNLHKCKFPGCEKYYYSGSTLDAHLASHMPNKVFECPYGTCDQKFKSMKVYCQHLNSHSNG